MPNTVFTQGTLVTSAWLNDINQSAYGPAAPNDSLHRRVIAVSRYPGADPTGKTDSAPAFAAAVAEAQLRGHCTILIDPGVYRLDSPIVINAPAAPARLDLPSFIGGGMNTCILKPTFQGATISVRGIPPRDGSGSQSGTWFYWGGELSYFTIDGALAPAAGAPFAGGQTDGIELLGVWHTRVHHVRFVHLRHGVSMPSDLQYNPNPDWSAPGKGSVDHCSFERMHGWGLYNPHIQGAPSWTVEENVFTLLGSGGILCSSSDWEIKKNGFGAMGWVDEVTAGGSATGCCIEYAGAVTANSKHVVHNNEFDGSRGASVRLVNCGPSQFYENRHIPRYQSLPGASAGQLYPPRAFHLAPNDATNAARGVVAQHEIVRIQNPGTFTYAEFTNTANVVDVAFLAPTLSDQTSGAAIVRHQTGATVSNMHVRQGYRVTGTDLANAEQLGGRPPPGYLGKLAGTPQTTTTETKLAFDAPDAVLNQIWPGLYADGVFLAPAHDWYEVHARVAVVPSGAGETHEIRLYVNGALTMADVKLSAGTTRVFPEIRMKVWAEKGQALEVRTLSSAVRTVTGAYSYLSISQRG